MGARAEKLFTPGSLPTAAPPAPSDREILLVRALHLGAGAGEAGGHGLRVAGHPVAGHRGPGLGRAAHRVAAARPPWRHGPLGRAAARQRAFRGLAPGLAGRRARRAARPRRRLRGAVRRPGRAGRDLGHRAQRRPPAPPPAPARWRVGLRARLHPRRGQHRAGPGAVDPGLLAPAGVDDFLRRSAGPRPRSGADGAVRPSRRRPHPGARRPGARVHALVGEDGGMDRPDPDALDAVLSLALAVAAGDEEAAEVFLRAHEPADLAVAGADVVWRMAAALGQLVEPKRSAPQMIHVFAEALRDADADAGGPS